MRRLEGMRSPVTRGDWPCSGTVMKRPGFIVKTHAKYYITLHLKMKTNSPVIRSHLSFYLHGIISKQLEHDHCFAKLIF